MRLDNSTKLSLIVRKGGGEGWYRNGAADGGWGGNHIPLKRFLFVLKHFLPIIRPAHMAVDYTLSLTQNDAGDLRQQVPCKDAEGCWCLQKA